jgi:hypothetical protein
MTKVSLYNSSDTFTNETAAYVKQNYADVKRLLLGNVASNRKYSYHFFAIPFAKGVTITSAKLRIYNAETWSGSNTLTVKPVSAKWKHNKLKWSNQPGVKAASATSGPVTGAVANTPWEFDVTSMMQDVANVGGTWYGFRITTNASGTRRFWSSEAQNDYRPVLEVEWVDIPDAPDQLVPRDSLAVSVQRPTFQCDYSDPSGNGDMTAIQVQINTTSSFTSPAYDSGQINTTTPQFVTDTTDPEYLTAPAWGGISVGQTLYWRVRVKGSDWGGWSDPEPFTRISKSVFQMDSPSAADPKVYEATPPIDWSKTSGTPTQVAYRVEILNVTKNVWVYDSGRITSTETSHPLPPKILNNGESYQARVRIYDNQNRIAVPNDKDYVELTQAFTVGFSASVAPVTSLAASDEYPYPWVTLTWSRSSTPDGFDIYRDGKILESGEYADYSLGGTNYEFVDRTAKPYTDHTYQVVAIVNSVGSSSSPTVDVTPRGLAPCVSLEDGSYPVFFMDPEIAIAEDKIEELVEFLGDVPPILITGGTRGFRGSLGGILVSDVVDGLTADQMRDNFESLQKKTGMKAAITVINQSFKGYLFNMNWAPAKDNEGVYYIVSAEFIQEDFKDA